MFATLLSGIASKNIMCDFSLNNKHYKLRYKLEYTVKKLICGQMVCSYIIKIFI